MHEFRIRGLSIYFIPSFREKGAKFASINFILRRVIFRGRRGMSKELLSAQTTGNDVCYLTGSSAEPLENYGSHLDLESDKKLLPSIQSKLVFT